MSPAPFLTGSLMRHVVSTTMLGTIGLMAIFVVDLADLYFLTLLDDVAVVSAVGYAGSILFFTMSVSIGQAIAISAQVARAIGQGDRDRARRVVIHGWMAVLMLSIPTALLIWIFVPEFLSLVGATGPTHELAVLYLRIILPTMPVMALAMSSGGVLRGVGLPKLAMWSTVSGALANAIFDPILIFALDLGLAGAAIASVIARFVVLGVGLYGVIVVARMLGRYSASEFAADMRAFFGIALPAMATNVATPFGNFVMLKALAPFGDSVVAGFAMVGRITPVAFGIIFALSGAIGPIVGQNAGGGRMDRVRQALVDSMLFTIATVAGISALLFLFQDAVADLFSASDGARAFFKYYATWVAGLFVFSGLQFVANAAFNNLGKPVWSTVSNWGRATLGTIPLVWLGAAWYGAPGVLMGQAIGGVIFGTLAFAVALRLAGGRAPTLDQRPGWRRTLSAPLSALSQYRGWVIGFLGSENGRSSDGR